MASIDSSRRPCALELDEASVHQGANASFDAIN
jgi:hypothetical protein